MRLSEKCGAEFGPSARYPVFLMMLFDRLLHVWPGTPGAANDDRWTWRLVGDATQLGFDRFNGTPQRRRNAC